MLTCRSWKINLCRLLGIIAISAPVCASTQRSEVIDGRLWLPSLEAQGPSVAISPQLCETTNPAGAPELTYWTGVALDLIIKYERNAVKAARTLAYLHVAMHDALVIGHLEGLCGSEVEIAAHMTAADTLAYLFPSEPESKYESVLVALFAKSKHDSRRSPLVSDSARKVATRVVRAMRGKASSDGAERVWPISDRPATFEGMFVAPPPLFAFNPLEVWAGRWTSWTEMGDPVLAVNPPLEFGSDSYRKELAEVIAVSNALTPEQRRIAEDWHLDAGSVTPAGVWNRHAVNFALTQGLDQVATVRLLARLNIAMADATIACWKVKYHWWTMRPVTAAALLEKYDLKPALATPQHPSFVSGHAAVSAAAATVLAAELPQLSSTVQDMAREAAMSRLYGGIHFRSDNEEGLKLGRLIGAQVVAMYQ